MTNARDMKAGAAQAGRWSAARRPRTLAAALVATLLGGVVAPAAANHIPGGGGAAGPGAITTVAGPLPDVFGIDEMGGELVVSQSEPGLVSKVEADGTITPFAGGGTIPLGDGGPATAATSDTPEGVTVDALGNLFVSERSTHRVRRVAAGGDGVVTGAPDEVITTVAGTGTSGFSGDGGPASAAAVSFPDRLAVDAAGNLFLSDEGNRRVRRVTPGADGSVDGDADEIITTVAGDGSAEPSGDGGPATAAGLTARAIAFDASGALSVGGGNLVRRVDPGADGFISGEEDETITTIAGGGDLLPGPGNPGEGAAATDVALDNVYSMAFDAPGNLFLVSTDIDVRNHVLRVDPTGVLTTAVGAGPLGGAGDGGPASAASLSWPYGLTFDGAGNLYVGELTGYRVRRVVPGHDGVVSGASDETITRFAGTGLPGFSGDAGPATAALVDSVAGLGAAGGDLYLADRSNNRVRRVDPAGIITTVAGGGSGDGGPADEASLSDPRGVVVDTAGNVLIADCGNSRVRQVDPGGAITTLLGPLPCPAGLHLVASGPTAGTLYVALAGGHSVIKRAPSGAVTTVAGGAGPGFSGDGGAATAAQLKGPNGVHVDGAGNVFIADTGNNRVRRVDAATGTISTVAGDGSALFGVPAGVPATSTSVAGPSDMTVDAGGNLLIAETLFSRLRRVDPAGIISTIAGNGIPAYGGDGGPATDANVNKPTHLDLDADGNLLFTDRGSARVRKIMAGTPPPAPVSKKVDCGFVATKSLTLTQDIGPCEGDGLVVGRDNITINLNGRRIFGTADANSKVGIRLTGRTGVRITGTQAGGPKGTVSDFDAGVAIIGGSHNTVENLRAQDNIGFDIYGDGIATFFSSFNVIRSNEVTNNGMYDGIGILGIGTRGNVVQGNTVTRSNAQEEIVGAGIGIVLTPFLDEGLPREQSIFDNQILDNVVRDNDNSGISNISNVNGLIRGNLVEGNGRLTDAIPANGIGIQNLRSAPPEMFVTVEGNTIRGNGSVDADGFPFSGDGINVTSKQNRIVNNRIETSQYDGISVVGSENEVTKNRVERNGRDGILVTSHDNTLSANRAHRNTSSGLKVEFGSSGNQLRNNNAADNGDPIADFESFFFQGDLVDVNADFQEDPFLMVFSCDANTWSGNLWGSGGFFPDPALSDPDAGVLIEEACTTTGGRQAGGKSKPRAVAGASRGGVKDSRRPADPHNPVGAPQQACQPARRCVARP